MGLGIASLENQRFPQRCMQAGATGEAEISKEDIVETMVASGNLLF